MSVEVKTPTKTPFEHIDKFPCGERDVGQLSSPAGALFTTTGPRSNGEGRGANNLSGRRYTVSCARPDNIRGRKRRFSERGSLGSDNVSSTYQATVPSFSGGKKRFGRGGFLHKGPPTGDKKNVMPKLPTRFLLGGNITDPLNLNSMCNEEVNRALNQSTPHSSPIPLPAHKKEKVEVLIPPNINDPLNLNVDVADEIGLTSPKASARKKKNKHKKRKSTGDLVQGPVNLSTTSACEDETEEDEKQIMHPPKDYSRPMHINIEAPALLSANSSEQFESKLLKSIDRIVSPVIPQRSPPRKRRRACSDGAKYGNYMQNISKTEDFVQGAKADRVVQPKPKEQKPKVQRQTSGGKSKHTSKHPKFVHGNYNRYYGYRNPSMEEDQRLKCFRKEWFEGRDVLDIGCNVGHVTLSIARDYGAHRITGMDIDGSLIAIAKKNIRHYISRTTAEAQKYPASLSINYGPLAAPPVPAKGDHLEFPNNVMFMTANYVLENDDLLEHQKEEYDVILALSISKWIHLNNGDNGLKRFFKRIFRNLRPGGKFVLEPQSWASYKKKKKLSDTIFKNFQSIKMRPEQFTEYLLSREVGFSTCQAINTPFNKSKGFQRPIQVFTKSDTAAATPWDGAESRGVTPHTHNTDSGQGLTPRYLTSHPSSRGATPKFDIGSPDYEECSTCQNTPCYSCTPVSGNCTPLSSGSSPSSTPQAETLVNGDAETLVNGDTETLVNGDCAQDTSTESVTIKDTSNSPVPNHIDGK